MFKYYAPQVLGRLFATDPSLLYNNKMGKLLYSEHKCMEYKFTMQNVLLMAQNKF